MSHSIQVVRAHPPDLQPHHRPLPHIDHVHACQYKRHHAVTCCAEVSKESIGGRRVGGGGVKSETTKRADQEAVIISGLPREIGRASCRERV